MVALITAIPATFAGIAALIAARRSGQARDNSAAAESASSTAAQNSAAAESASSAAAQNAATAVTNTAPISNGFASHVTTELQYLRDTLTHHVNNKKIHGR